MGNSLSAISAEIRQMQWSRLRTLEAIAVVCSLLYTILITYGLVWCWSFSLVSIFIYLYICYQKRIYAESSLQIFYVGTSIYGWLSWGKGLPYHDFIISSTTHTVIILCGSGLVAGSGFLLRRFSDAATPFVDSFTTIFSIFATLLMINFYPSNWIYFIVIDAVSVYLYFKRKLYLTALLFLLYTGLAVNGLMEWTQ